jgi:spore coat polysaccharide biosynthesis protein SpsF
MASASLGKQESLWRGEFGNVYTDRNAVTDQRLASLTTHWVKILRATIGSPPESILEVGANIGLNLRALRRLTNANLFALEPNAKARAVLVDEGIVPASNVHDGLATAIPLADDAVDFAFTSGVLIHIHPSNLLASCREVHRVTRRYLGCIEYFSDKEEEILYRGHTEALFKRDFGSFYLDNFPDLRVVDYGFAWKRLTGLDNLTWWLFEKRK